MAPLPERVFDPARTVYVRRPFVAAGRHLAVGAEFKWRQWALDQRRVRQLFDNGKLMHGTAMDSGLAAMQAREMVGRITPVPSVEQEMQDDDIHYVAVTTPAADEPPAPAEQVTGDGLDELGMKELREIAQAEDAPFRVSREAQREAIRENRRGKDQ